MKHRRRSILSFLLLIILVGGGIGLYVYLTPYHAESEAIEALGSTANVSVTNSSTHISFEVSKSPKASIIFYPGALVEPESYAPLAKELASHHINTYIVKMPLNLAVLGINKAKDILDDIPKSSATFIAGHSLGGAMAASYAGKHADQFDGLILLAAYANDDLSNTSLQVLSIYGSKDQVLNHKSYQEKWSLLPPSATEHIIEGGNHAQFGDYGFQKGDAIADISKEDQWKETAEAIAAWISLLSP